jgi:hypothetical protein
MYTYSRLSIPAIALALSVGCTSTITGNEGNFKFSYASDDEVANFNKPVAVGAKLDLKVTDVGGGAPVDLTSAAFDDPTILDVVSFAGNDITITGTGDGSALLEVAGATSLDEELTDSVNMLSAVPEVLKIWHPCEVTAEEAYYLTAQTVYLPFEMEMDNGQPVIGYGYHPVTVGGDGAAAINEDETGAQYLGLDTTATAGTAILTSDIDDTAITMNVVDVGLIDGIEEPVAGVAEDIDAGDTNMFYVRPQVGGVNVCQGDTAKTVTSDTPDICTVEDRDVPDSDESHEFGWFAVTGVAPGTCKYTVTFAEGNSGAGASGQFEYLIEP